MTLPSPFRRLCTAALCASVALTGCSFAGEKSSESSSSAEDVRLRLAMMQPPRSGLNPLTDDAFKLYRYHAIEGLVRLDPEGNAQPMLATKWQQTKPTEWSFVLRDGVKFHDGTDMTAQAVVASLNNAAKASPLPRILDGVEMEVRLDGKKVVVATKEPDPLLPQRMSSPQLAILSPRAYQGKSVTPINTATGAFKITKSNGTTGVTLDRFEEYWGDKARAAGLDVSYVPDGTARAAALRTGAADIVEAIPAGQAASIDEKLMHEVPMPRTNTLYLNTRKGLFADPATRAAVREAISGEQIVQKVYEGRADTAEGLLGPALPWVAEQRKDTAYARTLAERAAAEAPAGKPIIRIGTFTDRAELPEVAVQLQSMLQAKGFTVKLEVREYQYIEADALEGKFDAFILSRATILDSGDPVAYLTSDFTCAGSFNLSQLCDPSVDKAVAKAASAPAGEERRKKIALAEAAVLASDAAIPMLHERVVQGEQATVVDAARDPRERELVLPGTHVAK